MCGACGGEFANNFVRHFARKHGSGAPYGAVDVVGLTSGEVSTVSYAEWLKLRSCGTKPSAANRMQGNGGGVSGIEIQATCECISVGVTSAVGVTSVGVTSAGVTSAGVTSMVRPTQIGVTSTAGTTSLAGVASVESAPPIDVITLKEETPGEPVVPTLDPSLMKELPALLCATVATVTAAQGKAVVLKPITSP